ncbi:alpha-amylase family glycosyl hydrolase [Microbulbifer hainanensis]|uniref:alpha-amylase family glycosyl hydrolase n=1 Tax=Microbulbifer hainanensis TaxID=2735675 RepID=UPI00186866D1|nr:alpha-amylase family glycosyl hydrolase [Microbulbifer hainanensis]
MKRLISLIALLCLSGCSSAADPDPFWRNATVYFLLTDRFNNGDPNNDLSYGRKNDAAKLRGFAGGDLQGVIDKLDEGYFNELGVDAIWTSPVFEQIHGSTDEGTGRTYAYHGYWPSDWTAVDANFGSEADLARMVETAHRHGIRVLMDVIVNHTGPVTDEDPQWPDSWVRTQPTCDWSGYAGAVDCTLVENLPDIRTDSDKPVDLPPRLVAKWQAEGRLDQERAELDAFFQRTGYPRAPKYYLIKWLTDPVRQYGVDGFRVDTAKHVEPEVWAALKKESSMALADWKARNPDKKLDDRDFFMVGEVYGFGANDFGATKGRNYGYGDRQVDFYNYGFDSLINFAFAQRAKEEMEPLFASYSNDLHGGALDGVDVLNYLTSHDDGSSYDRERKYAYDAALKLMLAPGAAQIYYGDELARPLTADAEGDAQLRSFMNWGDLKNEKTRALLAHWQKLGQFRHAHPAVGAGVHKKLADKPYTFSRTLNGNDRVLVSTGLPAGEKTLSVYDLFADGTRLKDYYSRREVVVKNGAVSLDTPFELLLLGQPSQKKSSDKT